MDEARFRSPIRQSSTGPDGVNSKSAAHPEVRKDSLPHSRFSAPVDERTTNVPAVLSMRKALRDSPSGRASTATGRTRASDHAGVAATNAAAEAVSNSPARQSACVTYPYSGAKALE